MKSVPHFAVPDAGQASAWHAEAFGAQEQPRVRLLGGKVTTLVLQVGESTVQFGRGFPEAEILSASSVGAATVLRIDTDHDAAAWDQALAAGAPSSRALRPVLGRATRQRTDFYGPSSRIAQHIGNVSDGESAARASEAVG